MRLLTSILTAFAFVTLTVSAQTNVTVEITGNLGGQPFEKNITTMDPSGSYAFSLKRLSYYISEVYVIHDGGQKSECEDLYFLVHADKMNTLDLGDHDVQSIEGVQFSIGVDKFTNHEDPTRYPSGHPLGLQNPSMHWGWTAGYRFVAIEGRAGPDQPSQIFEVHSVGDELYTTITINVGASKNDGGFVIPLVADYSALLTDISAQWGTVIVHGDFGEAITLMDNFKQHVYTPGVVASVDEVESSTFGIAPNPAYDVVTVTGIEQPSTVTIRNVAGETVLVANNASAGSSISINTLPTGQYMLSVQTSNGTPSTTLLNIVR